VQLQFPSVIALINVHSLFNNILQESAMPNPNITFDHVHLISKDVAAAANWYVDKLGGDIVRNVTVKGAPQVYVEIGGGTMLIVRGERPGESTAEKPGLEWGVDHFGVRVKGNFEAFCADLKAKGVVFSVEPTQFNPTTQLAFINAPDGVSVELLNRQDKA
jgi:lactoylglutathione lyase